MQRLPAGAPVVDNQLLSNRSRDVDPAVLFNHGKREVNSCRHAGGGPDRAINDKYAILLNGDVRVARLNLSREQPMRGRAPAVEQARARQNEGAGAN